MSNGPEDFVSFSDYLGLNDEAGQQMTERAMAGSDKLRSAAMAAPDAIYNAAVREVDEGVGGAAAFERTRERARTGLASYSDFMRGMADPAERQAMMAKAYGGASVSRFDSMLAGEAGGGRIAAGQKDAQSMGTQFESRLMDADARRASDTSRIAAQTAAQTSEDAQRLAARQAEAKRREDDRLGEEYAMSEFDYGGPPNAAAMSARDRSAQIQMRSKFMKVHRRADGGMDWNSYRNATNRLNAQLEANEAGDVKNWGVVKGAHSFFTGIAGGGSEPKRESWDDFRKRRSTTGAK